MVSLTLLRTTLFTIVLASMSVSALPVPDGSGAGNNTTDHVPVPDGSAAGNDTTDYAYSGDGSGNDTVEFEMPHKNFSCEELEPSRREANLVKLGSLQTGLTVLQNNSSKLNDEWVSKGNSNN